MGRLLSHSRTRRIALQALFLGVVALVVVTAAVVGSRNIAAQGMATGWGFLDRSTGWPIGFSIIEITSRSTYARVLWAGMLNTMLVGFLALVLASLVGLVIALLRVSGNRMLMFVGTVYVEMFRNVPVILQVFFWYAILTHLPSPRAALDLGGVVWLSNRGLMLPAPVLSAMDGWWLAGGAALAAGVLLVRRGRPGGGLRLALAALGLAALFTLLLLTGRAADAPLVSLPELRGLRFVGGATIKPEFTALLVGLTVFGAAYIGEIVRGGLLSVDRGRLEAGAALGLTSWQVNRLIRIPLAVRAMLPALSNQYVWLMKATTVGIAIGYPDYFAIVSSSINQTGQTLELLALLMGGFLILNYAIAAGLNALNRKLAIKGHS